MSLLMEALKKAERAKQAQEQGGQQTAQPGGVEEMQLAPDESGSAASQLDASSEPPAPDAVAATGASNLALRGRRPGRGDFPKLELESIDDREFDLDPVKPRAAPAADAEAHSRAAARAVFDAKQPEAAARSRTPLIAGAMALLAVLGGGGYYWMQMQTGSSSLVKPGQAGGQLAYRPPVPTAPVQAPVTAPATNVPSDSTLAPLSAPPSSTPSAASAPQSPSTDKPDAPRATASTSGTNVPRASSNARAGGTSTPTERQDRPQGAFKVSPSAMRVDPAVDAAYRAFIANDFATARAQYRSVLTGDPGNRDALLGLAGIAARDGKLDEAETLYLQILRLDPGDAYAQTGLISIRSQADPLIAESRLKSLIANQGEAAFLHYALGNLYARQKRWNEAQQEYFRALALDGDNPDYSYNLAVSLDQMRQPRVALTHYQRALVLSASKPASFDPGQLRVRISELQK